MNIAKETVLDWVNSQTERTEIDRQRCEDKGFHHTAHYYAGMISAFELIAEYLGHVESE